MKEAKQERLVLIICIFAGLFGVVFKLLFEPSVEKMALAWYIFLSCMALITYTYRKSFTSVWFILSLILICVLMIPLLLWIDFSMMDDKKFGYFGFSWSICLVPFLIIVFMERFFGKKDK